MLATAASSVAVGLGELFVERQGELVAYSLGSCVAICLFDPLTRVAGMAHVVLPRAPEKGPGDTPGKYADTAVPALLQALLLAHGGVLCHRCCSFLVLCHSPHQERRAHGRLVSQPLTGILRGRAASCLGRRKRRSPCSRKPVRGPSRTSSASSRTASPTRKRRDGFASSSADSIPPPRRRSMSRPERRRRRTSGSVRRWADRRVPRRDTPRSTGWSRTSGGRT